ncbi:hypothetical protein CY0110_27550 [Crocosphaera chwakensis CCY0110]|uniref:Lipopolysaccharide assembly protein A domain-containing protein n=2 Tax=Crocosphaera TaxID=263510 RepID=A3IR50_9CHRO|nr:hypothetical protein CY0110_27550 [Crocosphaera chwakensis CCY0110]
MAIGTGIILLQNQQPIILYFLGTDEETALFALNLPLAIWILIFTLAGIISSFLIQLFTRSSRVLSFNKPRNSRPRSPEPAETPYQRPEPKKKSDWETPPPPEWENNSETQEDDAWDIEEPPEEKTIPRNPSTVQDTRSEFEKQQPPRTVSQEGTVYSYTYRELSDRSDRVASEPPPNPPKSEQSEDKTPPPPPNGDVYDAQYRIITPPYQPSQESNDEDEENEEDPENWI